MLKLKIDLNHINQGLKIDIIPNIQGTIFIVDDFNENNEAQYQIVEGCFYQYKLSNNNFRLEESEIIETSKFHDSEGRLSPNFHVGTLKINVLDGNTIRGEFTLEVQSIKTSYREDYRYMLESITKYSTDLILQTNSPVNQSFEIDINKNTKTLYQQFCFVNSIVNNEEFEIAIQQIITSPVTKWGTTTEQRDVRSLKKLNSKDIRNMAHSKNRAQLPQQHPLNSLGLNAIAFQINTSTKIESVDTAENKFIKYVLQTFLFFCESIQLKSQNGSRLNLEAESTSNKLESYLQHNIFKEVSKPTSLALNSPILQNKSCYREVLKTWLMFDLAAKLTWEGGDDIYEGGKKNVAKLYEYWLFFKLLDAIKQIFKIESDEYKKLIKPTTDGLALQLKEGRQIALNGSHISKERELSIQFTYNRTFGINNELSAEGSWTLQMEPDYTLSIWPKELNKSVAEKTEQLIHVHFDAKYKVKNKENNSEFKREDIIKMHAYKDAIRRTGGAYILYPGTENNPTTFKGFHEILPGLGAFAIRPSNGNTGMKQLINFIKEIKNHFLNRASQRENISTKTYEITKEGPPLELHEKIPEYFNNDKLIPQETNVLVGFYKSPEHLNWIESKKLYNFRMGSGNGSLILKEDVVNAKYLLLHSRNDEFSNKLWKIVSQGPKVFSKEQLEQLDYDSPSQPFYLIYELEEVNIEEFGYCNWHFKQLNNYRTGHASALPFTTTLTELFKNKVEE